MKKIVITIMLLIITVIGLTTCCTPDSKFEDTKWFLNSYGDQDNLEALIEDTEITSTFDSVRGEVSGSSGCNTYSARYEVKGSKLSISEIAVTEMACISPEGLMEQERRFLSLLADAQSFRVDDTTLTVFCSGERQLYFTMATRFP